MSTQDAHKHSAPLSAFDADVVDLREVAYILRANLWGILGFSVVVSLLAILVIYSMAPIFRADATMLIESDSAKVVSIEEVVQMGTGRSEYYNTQFEILKSRELAIKVVTENIDAYKTLMQHRRESSAAVLSFLPRNQIRDDEQSMIADFMENTSIEPIRGTQLVKIGFEAEEPDFAAKMANDLARAYIENNLEARLAMTQQAAFWLSGRIDGLKSKLRESEQKLQEYRESEGLIDVEGATTVAVKELDEISAKLSQARQNRLELENISKQVNQATKNSADDFSAIPAVLKQTLVQHFKEQEGVAEQKLSELSKRYGEKHPKIIAARSDLDVAKQNTKNQISKVIEGVHNEFEVAKGTEEALTKEMEVMKERVQEVNRKQYRLDELTREVTVNRQLYDTFFSRIKETAEARELQLANARVVDPATTPKTPIKPRRLLLSAASVALSLMIGIVLALAKEATDSTVRTRDDVFLKLHTQLLGVLPLLKDKIKSGEPCLEYATKGTGNFSESIRTIRTAVVLSGLDNPHKILVVTSSIPGEGKTTVSSNLAVAFGQTGKTLLIDADMRRPSIAKNFNIKLSSPGLSNLVAETADPKACIHRIANLDIDVIPAGTIPPNPLELLSSQRFATVMAELEKHYDRIIIDSPPSEVVSDAMVLATFASALIYVVKADSTNMKIVKSGISRLRDANAPLSGVILNQVNIEKNSGYGHGYGNYYGGYYDYYGYSGSSPEKDKV